MNIDNMVPGSGRMRQDDDVVVNIANYFSPTPNGDQSITVSEAGVSTLTPPNSGSIMAKIVVPTGVDCWVRFGAVPAIGTGEYFGQGDEIVFESVDEIAEAQILVTGPCVLFVQYYK